MTNDYIYPNIMMSITPVKVLLFTTVRKKYGRTWYKQDVIETSYFTNGNEQMEIVDAVARFHKSIYNLQILGKADRKTLKAVYLNGVPAFIKDTSQISEQERLKQLNGLA